MTLKSGIEIPKAAVSELCRNYGVSELSVFGSAARGDMRAESDIDVMVDFLPEALIGLFRFASLKRRTGEVAWP
jgi:predicted nucleotidyltransferase